MDATLYASLTKKLSPNPEEELINMDALLIFDRSNDLIYKNLNFEMNLKIRHIAITQNLLSEENTNLDDNIIMQIFSPIINSQKLMFCQFDNTYSSFQCGENLNFVFADFLGYIFLKMGTQSVENLRRNVGVCISFVKHICGTNLLALKKNEKKSCLLSDLIETWQQLYDVDQSVLIEGIDNVVVNAEVRKVINHTLKSAAEKLKEDPDSQRCHAILFVTQKFVGLYSSIQAQSLAASDILFLSILNKTIQSKLSSKAINIQSHLIFLDGHISSAFSGCIPHIVHTSLLDKGVALTLLIEYGNLYVASNIYDTFFALQKLQNIQLQGDLENLKFSFDSVDNYVRQTVESVKKAKYNNVDIDSTLKKFATKWEILRKKYLDFLKDSERDLIIRIESNLPGFSEDLKELFITICLDCEIREYDFGRISEISALVEEKLLEFSEFISVKAQRNISINSYLEEFPGLVHFIYVDRAIGTITAPDLVSEKYYIPKEKIWSMVQLCRSYLSKGHTSIMWKDNAFNYSYFLWFEDQNGITIKPKDTENFFTSTTNIKPKSEPGILTGDYYHRLCETFFPKMSPSKVKCCELYCIHLGLVTATCALEHSRRLIATISELTGTSVFEIL